MERGVEALLDAAQEGDLVLTLGAGNVWQAGDAVLARLRRAERLDYGAGESKVAVRAGAAGCWPRRRRWCCASPPAVAAWQVRSFVLTDPQFTALAAKHRDALVVQGVRYASRARVVRRFRRGFRAQRLRRPARRAAPPPAGHRLGGGRHRLAHLAATASWCGSPSASPVAFVNLPLATGTTRVLLIDRHGVLLEPPPQARFAFPVLSGITEAQSEHGRRMRVRRHAAAAGRAGAGWAKIFPRSTRRTWRTCAWSPQVEGRAVELHAGRWRTIGRRYQTFLAHYPEIRKRSPEVTYVRSAAGRPDYGEGMRAMARQESVRGGTGRRAARARAA